MKDILESNETQFFMILHENPIIWIHVHFFSFWSNFHRLHTILAIQSVCQVCEFRHLLNSNSHEKWKSNKKILKIHNQTSKKFSTLLIFKLSSCDSSPSLMNRRLWIFEKKQFWDFWFDQLWPFNFLFSCRAKYSNHNILVCSHLILKLKIVSKSSWLRESMVRNLFWDLDCFTSENPCNSSTSPRANC